MGGLQIPSCSNCREITDKDSFACMICVDLDGWKSRRGRKLGSRPKPGDKKTGPKEFEDRTLLRRYVNLSFTAKDITKAGGYKKVKADLEKAFYDKINKS